MEKPMSSGLKVVFLVHAIMGTSFGLIYLLIPTTFGNLVGWQMADPTAIRVIGASAIGLSIGSVMAVKATVWANVKILVQVEIAHTILTTFAFSWGLLFNGYPPFALLTIAVTVSFAIAFVLFYRRHEAAVPQPKRQKET